MSDEETEPTPYVNDWWNNIRGLQEVSGSLRTYATQEPTSPVPTVMLTRVADGIDKLEQRYLCKKSVHSLGSIWVSF